MLITDRYTCENCIWQDDCSDDYACEHFSPITESIDSYIEEKRLSFYIEWIKYIEN